MNVPELIYQKRDEYRTQTGDIPKEAWVGPDELISLTKWAEEDMRRLGYRNTHVQIRGMSIFGMKILASLEPGVRVGITI